MKTENYLDPERLAKLQQRIWDVATAHGWHEKPISTAQYCGLIMTEMARTKIDPKERVTQRLNNTLQQLQVIREELLTVERLNGLTFAQCPSSDRLIMAMCGYTSPKEWHDAVVSEYNKAYKRYTKYRKQIYGGSAIVELERKYEQL